MLDLAPVRAQQPGRRIVWLESTGSTMAEALKLLREGCASGTVVGAEEQTAGKGRLGRNWHSQRGAGLYASLVLRTSLEGKDLPALTMALGLAAAESITATAGVRCDLRWPNDVLLQGRKCAGILTELHGKDVVAGIGINVNQSSFPAELAPAATSLRLASGRSQSREGLLARLLEAVDAYLELLTTHGPMPILALFSQASSYVHGRRVVVDQEGEALSGTTDGLDACGFLRLRLDDGSRRLILAGGVRPA